jgi:predicted metal-dependent HD superfamily phosphohydrolase
MPDKLKDVWLELCGHYSKDLTLKEGLYDELYKKYTGTARHYHNLQHITELLQLADQYDQFLQHKDLVRFAIFYHDILYNVLRKDNEPRSAVLAEKRLKLLGLPVEKREAVKSFIEATQTHTIPDTAPNRSDLSFFLDFDMAILGAPWEQYQAYFRQVRKEYRVYPDLLYRPGRKAFLEKTLQTAHLFHTALFRGQYEAQARANMERELQLYV